MENRVNSMSSEKFELIKGWISEHLKVANEIVRSQGRDVIIGTGNNAKVISIPKLTGDNKLLWKEAWIKVFEECLNVLYLKVNYIYSVGSREGSIVQLTPNEVRVGKEIVRISDDHNSVEYARALEKIILTYNNLKVDDVLPINFSQRTIKIDIPTEPCVNMYKVDSNLMESVSDADLKNKIESKVEDVNLDKKQVVIQKVPANVTLDKEECRVYQEQSLVIATCISVKHGCDVFRDNIEILRRHVPNISIGSFIGGRSTNVLQASKEGTRILRLLDECNVSNLVIYEVNNDYINRHIKCKDDILSIIEAFNKVCEILTDGGYYPFLCMDFNTYCSMKDVVCDYIDRYPVIKCVTPKQRDLVDVGDDILYMNPSSDSDALMVGDEIMQDNLAVFSNNSLNEVCA